MANNHIQDEAASKGAAIIAQAESVGLDPRVLYEAVVDLSAEGLLTANCLNLAAGILLQDLGLPKYFFANLHKATLAHLLQSIAVSIKVVDGQVTLHGSVAQIDFEASQAGTVQWVRIATEDTRDSMETLLEHRLAGHRREYYFSPESKYSTYIIRPEMVKDYPREVFAASRFLFSVAGDFQVTPEATRRRYERFLRACEQSIVPLVEVYNLPDSGETRLMFNSDFVSPQLQVLRRILADHGLVLQRAYWEPYLAQASVSSSICTLYVGGELTRQQEVGVIADLRAFLSFAVGPITRQYLEGHLSFQEMLFAGNAIDFAHLFIFKESENITDREILENLTSKDQREAFAKRVQTSNKSTYTSRLILDTVAKNPDLISFLYKLFERKFSKHAESRLREDELSERLVEFEKTIASRFLDFPLGYEIFKFLCKLITCTLKTNFYKMEKRSFCFRFDNRILDPLVFNRFVYGIFLVNGHYATGTHLRAADIARGGLRLIRVSRANYDTELDNAVLLNYALGPKAQRLKHKDICESGSKGVVVPRPEYAGHRAEALNDYTEGIMDLILPDENILDYYGKPEMVFFGPDEGTAPLMDDVAYHAKARGYKHWRTLTTGKSFGIPHDTYGLLNSGETFGLYDHGDEGVDLQVDGERRVQSSDMGDIYGEIGGRIAVSGMTTTSIMGSFRTLIAHNGKREEDLNLMMTGGPDGDLGANQIQCYKGKICLIIDGGSVLFDPQGLDREELTKLAMMRNSRPRVNSLGFPATKLSKDGFRVPIEAGNVTLPDGRVIRDGALFHRNFLCDPANRKYVEQANIQAFIPCGGFKDTINHGNVRQFAEVFRELRFIVEGANVFFDDGARRYLATNTAIKQIKDTTANKGGVFSSSIAEVLTAFLLQDGYEAELQNDPATRWALIRDIIGLVDRYSRMETALLLKLHDAEPTMPLFMLSEKSSEEIFSLQDLLEARLPEMLAVPGLAWRILEHYVPSVLQKKLGQERIMALLNSESLLPYRDAILTKKMASLAYYRFGEHWNEYLRELEQDFIAALEGVFAAKAEA
jgi:glutamate dehydrogenase